MLKKFTFQTKLFLFVFILCFGRTVSTFAQSLIEQIDSIRKAKNIAGISACVVKEGRLVWRGECGYARTDLQKPVKPESMFMLASISKTFTTVAALKAYEMGLVTLDEPVDTFLGYPVKNPAHPDVPITLRQLLTHSSSIQDNWDIMGNYFYEIGADTPITLDSCVRNYFTPGGEYYDGGNFYDYPPNQEYNYANMGFALIGAIVEKTSGVPFNVFCRTHIFNPLCMENTGWFLSEIDSSQIAYPTTYEDGEYYPELFTFADYPDGQVFTTATSLAKFMYAVSQNGLFNQTQLLADTLFQRALSKQFEVPDFIQGWGFYGIEIPGDTLWGHDGGETGVSTEMYFSKNKQTGVIVLANGDDVYGDVFNLLFIAADTMETEDKPLIDCDLATARTPLAKTETPLRVYPNPAAGYVNISGAFSTTAPMILIDSKGASVKEVYPETSDGVTKIATDGLAAGVYTLKILDAKHKPVFKRIVITK